jgi:hypothetical protein
MIKIDLDDTYEPISIIHYSAEFTYQSEFIFQSELEQGNSVDLHIRFSKIDDNFLPNVYNLAFGPINDKNEIDDKAKIPHKNLNKLFSSIILFVITFLDSYDNARVGIDGSNETRAYLYHRIFLSNQSELKETLITVGVDWYVRLLRNGSIEVDSNGLPFFKPKPEPFDLARKATDLYRYYLIELK